MRHANYVAFLSLCLVLQLLMPALKPARRLSAQTWLSQPGMTPVSSDAQRSAYVAGPRDHVWLPICGCSTGFQRSHGPLLQITVKHEQPLYSLAHSCAHSLSL